jgi:hypothetical protein
MACARKDGSETFDVVATTSDDTPVTCPLADMLLYLNDEDNAKFLQKMLEIGILRRVHGPGIYEFAPMEHPCPFTQQPQQEEKQP